MDDKFEPRHVHFTELMKNQKEFKDLKNLLNDDISGATFEIKKFQYPENKEEYLCFRTYREVKNAYKDRERVFRKTKALYRELYILNQARHPCLVELLYFDIRPKIFDSAIVTRFYEFGSLAECFQNEQYKSWRNPTRYTLIMYGIARGIRYLHELKILHRDIKPENIVIDKNFKPHIGDFDLAKVANDDEYQSGEMGTFLYMAPEIQTINGQVLFSYPADVFALAFVFYALTNGRNNRLILPKKDLYGKTKEEIIEFARKKIHENYVNGIMPQFKKNNLKHLNELISKMWSPNQKDRPTMNQVCRYLENYEYWFPGTDTDAFEEYKKEIDDYEKVQLRLIRKKHSYREDEAYLREKLDNAEEKEEKFQEIIDDMYNIDSSSVFTNFTYKEFRSLLKCSTHFNKEAEYALGLTFYFGFRGIPKNYVSTVYFLNRSKFHGNEKADQILSSILTEIVENEDKEKVHPEMTIDLEGEFFRDLKNPKSQLLMGMVNEGLGKNNEALSLYMKSAKSGSFEARGRVGSLLLKCGQKLDEAEVFLRQASKWKCNEHETVDENERKVALFDLGLLELYVKKEFDEAIEIFNSLLHDEHPDAAYYLSLAYSKKGDEENAEKFKKIAIEQFSSEF